MAIFDKSKIGLWYGPFLMLCAFIAGFSAVVWVLNVDAHKNKQVELRYTSESLAKSIEHRLKGNEDYLVMLARDRAAGSLGPGMFQERASAYVREHSEIINITWVDADFYISDVAPRAANRPILGLHLDLAEPKRASTLAKGTGRPVYTHPFEAIQGRSSFEVWVPVYDGSRFIGLLGGIYSCQRLLETLVPPHVRQAEHAALLDASGVTVAELFKTGNVDRQMTYRVALAAGGSGLVVQLGYYCPSPEIVKSGKWRASPSTLCVTRNQGDRTTSGIEGAPQGFVRKWGNRLVLPHMWKTCCGRFLAKVGLRQCFRTGIS